jgi:hypothetical protein
MEKLKTYIIVTLALVVMIGIISIKSCKDNIETLEKITVKEIHDTIRPKPIIIYLPPKSNPIAIKEIIIEKPDSNLCKIQRIYNDSIVDTNQTIYYTASTIGKLENITLGYKLKIPLIINNTKEITIHETETKLPNFSMSAGLSLIGNRTQFDIAPLAILNFKNKSIIYSYHILQNQHQIGVAIRLFKTKK